jgi:hypothetical protein
MLLLRIVILGYSVNISSCEDSFELKFIEAYIRVEVSFDM